MIVKCPFCAHKIEVRNAKSGRYTPKCGKCGERFILLVKGEPSDEQKMVAFKTAEELEQRVQKIRGDGGNTGMEQTPSEVGISQHDKANAVNETMATDSVTPANKPAEPPADIDQTLASPAASEPDDDMDITLPGPGGAGGDDISIDTPEPTTRQERAEAPTPDPDQVIENEQKGKSYPAVERSAHDADNRREQGGHNTADEAVAVDGARGPEETLADINDSATPDMASDSGVDLDQTLASDPGVTMASDAGQTLASNAGNNATLASDPNATAASQGGGSSNTAAAQGDLTGTLGGFQIQRLLGRGGMGSVYLAKQLSLDRNIALKTMNPQWAQDPIFLSRFTREAYAAAQLVHHNVVQIYDIGEDKKTHFFSMEFVPGKSLQDLVNEKGALDAEEAVGYILQAARGLKFAHDHGMVHRDIKPDNLMINEQGIVKVADLGLVKTPGAAAAEEAIEQAKAEGKERPTTPPEHSKLSATSGVTQVGAAMGTPAYMAPEQATDAANVDERADIYSLGCTLYTMVTAKHIFEGKTVVEVMSKHATEPVIPPDAVIQRVPKNLSQIVLRMVAKKPHERFQKMDDLIDVLEDFLGVSSAGPFTPQEQHANLLESAVATFNKSSNAKLRGLIVGLFPIACIAATVLMALAGKFIAAGAAIGLLLLMLGSYFVLTGITKKTVLFAKTRQWLLGSKWTDWLMFVVGIIGAVVILWVFNLLWVWIGVCIIAAGLAAGFHFVIDKMVDTQRKQPLDEVQDMLRNMRLRGLEEDALRRFVCKYSGKNWEPLYEALFGYDAKISARQKWGKGDDGKPRKRHGVIRDGMIAWLDERQRAREEEKQAKYLQRVETSKLVAQGVDNYKARRDAQWAAQTMVASANKFQQQVKAAQMTPEGEALPEGVTNKVNVNQVIYGDENEQGVRELKGDSLFTKLANLLLGARMRFVVGAILLTACVLWMNQNDLIPGSIKDVDSLSTQAVKDAANSIDLEASGTQPLQLPGLPEAISSKLFNSFSPGLAGLILLVSCIFRGRKMTIFMVPAAAIVLAGHLLPVPAITELEVGPLKGQYLIWAVGGALFVVGVLFGRRRKDVIYE